MLHRIVNNDTFKALCLWTLIVLFAIGLSSCFVTKKQKDRHCASCPVVSVHNSITVEKIVPHDTTIYITRWSDPVYIESPCKDLCDSLGRLKSFSIIKKNNGLTTTVKSVGNSIVIDCKADSLKAVITILNKEKSVYVKQKDVKTITKNELTKLQGFWIVSGWGLWIVILIVVAGKILKSYFPALKILKFF